MNYRDQGPSYRIGTTYSGPARLPLLLLVTLLLLPGCATESSEEATAGSEHQDTGQQESATGSDFEITPRSIMRGKQTEPLEADKRAEPSRSERESEENTKQ